MDKIKDCQCQICEGFFAREDMQFTKDCHGIPFRFACINCYDMAMADGFDGEIYDEADENF